MREHGGKVRITRYLGRVIYGGLVDGDLYYYVAKGDGTDKIFASLDAAMTWIEESTGKSGYEYS